MKKTFKCNICDAEKTVVYVKAAGDTLCGIIYDMADDEARDFLGKFVLKGQRTYTCAGTMDLIETGPKKRKLKIKLPDINDVMSLAGLGSFMIALISCLFLIATWAITYADQMWAVYLESAPDGRGFLLWVVSLITLLVISRTRD